MVFTESLLLVNTAVHHILGSIAWAAGLRWFASFTSNSKVAFCFSSYLWLLTKLPAMSFQLNGGCTVKFQPWSKLSFVYSVVIFLTMIGFREATGFTSVEGPELYSMYSGLLPLRIPFLRILIYWFRMISLWCSSALPRKLPFRVLPRTLPWGLTLDFTSPPSRFKILQAHDHSCVCVFVHVYLSNESDACLSEASRLALSNFCPLVGHSRTYVTMLARPPLSRYVALSPWSRRLLI